MGRSAARFHIEICPTFAQNRCGIIGLCCQDLADKRSSRLAVELLDLDCPRSIERSHLELFGRSIPKAAQVVKVFIGSTGLSVTMTGSTS